MTGLIPSPSAESRTVCGIKGCTERATSLFAWPKRSAVPVCHTCGAKIQNVVQQMLDGQMPEWTPERWLSWLREFGKDRLFSERRHGQPRA